MRNIRGIVEYIGTAYCGFQIQKNGVSIAQKLEESIKSATGQDVKVVGSGRTDAGVHALGQVINFEIDCALPTAKMARVFNRFLPEDIRFVSCEEVSSSFNARKSAKKKTYLYRIDMGEIQSAFEINRSMHVGKPLDVGVMRKAAEALIGEHDFKAFMASNSQVVNTVRRIHSVKLTAKGSILSVEVCGNGFLYNMVRIIVGTLIDIGLGKKPVDTLGKMITTGDRALGGNTAKACGLYLKSVKYAI